MSTVTYDTSKFISSFNFFEWALYAKTQGATKVNFITKDMKATKWPLDMVKERVNSILIPGPALLGMGVVLDSPTHWRGDYGSPTGAMAVAAWRTGRMPRVRSVKPAGNARYTVTLRRTHRANGRDSDEQVWRDFAEEIGAHVIEDYDVQPIHLHDRVALYAGAEMNFFVSNGPGVLCSFTEYPCMLFDTHLAAGSLKSDGIRGWGAQYPWMLKNQYAIWAPATADNIRDNFYAWKAGNYDPANYAIPAGHSNSSDGIASTAG
jgi:hypothetical protein